MYHNFLLKEHKNFSKLKLSKNTDYNKKSFLADWVDSPSNHKPFSEPVLHMVKGVLDQS